MGTVSALARLPQSLNEMKDCLNQVVNVNRPPPVAEEEEVRVGGGVAVSEGMEGRDHTGGVSGGQAGDRK